MSPGSPIGQAGVATVVFRNFNELARYEVHAADHQVPPVPAVLDTFRTRLPEDHFSCRSGDREWTTGGAASRIGRRCTSSRELSPSVFRSHHDQLLSRGGQQVQHEVEASPGSVRNAAPTRVK